MTESDPKIYEFGEFRVEAGIRTLFRDGERVPLTPKVFDTLLHLIQHEGAVVEKDDLMRAVWPDTIVEENNLNQNISALRRVLGDRQGENRHILTVPGKGYRFISSVEVSAATPMEMPSRTTIAVLPFENLSADPGREYLADGLTEEAIAALGQVDPGHLSVIGRTSVMAYRRTTKSAAQIGSELGATYLVEGSLRAEGGRLRIRAGLVRVSDQVQLWTASYDSEPSSMLVFQRELSGVIAEQIRLRLSPERLTALARRQTKNAEAYDLYLRGRHFWHQLTPVTTRRAIEYYTSATQIDPNYALAWAGLADAFSASPINGDAPPLVVWPRAREAAARALSSEPSLAEVQASLGFLKFWLDWDWPAAEAAHHKAIELDPNSPLAHRMLGMLLSHMNRYEEASLALRRARELDPLLSAHHALSAQVAFSGRNYDAAVQFARHAIVVDPDLWIGHFQLAQAYVQLGASDQAFNALNQAGRTASGNSKVISLRGYLHAILGQAKEAHEVLNALQAISRERYVPPYAIALVYAGLHQQDMAMEWLERAHGVRDVHLIFLPVDSKWDPFRNNTRFLTLLKKCDFTPLNS